MSAESIVQNYLNDALSSFRAYKKLADKAIEQLHYSYHIGQIVFLAKHFRSAEWKSLSIPRNRSGEFNAYLATNPDYVADREKQFDAVAGFANKTERK